jgi:hypothetical protein
MNPGISPHLLEDLISHTGIQNALESSLQAAGEATMDAMTTQNPRGQSRGQ